MRASTKRISSIGFAGVFFIGTLMVYANLIKPEMKNIEERRSLVVSKETLFANQLSAVQQVQNLISQFQSFGKVQETVILAVPLKENTTQVLNQIRAIVGNSRVMLDSFSVKTLAFEPSRQPLAKRLGTLEVNLTARGAYDALKSFLRLLETNVRVTNVRKMRIDPVGSETGVFQDLYETTLTVEVFYQES